MNCPYCAEEIKEDAVICRYCRSPLFYPKPLMDDIRLIKSQIENLTDLVNSIGKTSVASGIKADEKRESSLLRSVIKIAVGNFILAVGLTTSTEPVVIGTLLFLGTIVIGAWVSRGIQRSSFGTYLYYGFTNVVFGFLARGLADLLTNNLQYRMNHWVTTYQEQYFYIGLIFIVVSWALAFVTGAYIADFIARFRNPSLQSRTMANRIAATLISGNAGSRAQGASFAQGIVANVIALAPPFFTLIGTLVSAYLGFLAAASKH